jgi:hypothetical protein
MQRRRQNGGELDDVPVLTDAIDEEDDIPVLLDAESPATAPSENLDALLAGELAIQQVAEVAEDPDEDEFHAPALDPGLCDLLAHELARRVEQRIVAELPRIIENTVRDFLAEQEMIAAQQPDD